MSFRCVPSFMQNNHRVYEASPLIFATIEEASAFGKMMFVPAQTIEFWEVKRVELPVNYSYKKGILTRRD